MRFCSTFSAPTKFDIREKQIEYSSTLFIQLGDANFRILVGQSFDYRIRKCVTNLNFIFAFPFFDFVKEIRQRIKEHVIDIV